VEYEWSSLKPYDEIEGDYILIVRCHPTAWQRSFRKATTRLRMYVGRKGSWLRYPFANVLGDKDPTSKQLDELFLAALQNI